MKKSVLALVVVALAAGSATGCSKKFQREWEKQSREYDRKEHNHKHHNRDRDSYDEDEEESGEDFSRFAGNYVAQFQNGERGAKIRVADDAVYINGHRAQDTNQVGNKLVARDGYATYTILTNGWGNWTDPDSGNSGSIHKG